MTTDEITDACHNCGNKKYKIKRDAGAITISMGICPICKKEKPIIPATDWAYMIGETNEWD